MLLLVLMLTCRAHVYAAAPQAGAQGPGFYRMMLGRFEITALLDGTHPFPIDTVVQGVSKQEIARDLHRDFLQAPVQGSINAFLVNTGTKLILIDTGAGVLYGDCCGRLIANLRAAGYAPAQVDEVLLTHLHKDHVGGIVTSGAMTFPNAIVRVSKAEADYWLDAANKPLAPAFLASFFDAAQASVAPYIAAGRFETFSGDTDLEPGFRAIVIPGHTPGHSAYRVESDGHVMLAWGDVIHVASIQLRNPRASVEYDNDAILARRSRTRMLDAAAGDGDLIAAAHIAFPGLGHVRKAGARYEWVPVNYEADPEH
ncbi:MBL fold metallo-hydrolase [Caballeronia megalochromosomata]|nr:MBL fold metallo-hydrolase [Caballeronia megalochromosomata]